MITGFNTDVEYNGVTYHVQTEDKGLDTPMIMSLVYNRGTILASKRSPYNDLLVGNFNEKELAERLNRQHKLICAAIRAGRIEDLKKMNAKQAATQSAGVAQEPSVVAKTEPEIAKVEEPTPQVKVSTELQPIAELTPIPKILQDRPQFFEPIKKPNIELPQPLNLPLSPEEIPIEISDADLIFEDSENIHDTQNLANIIVIPDEAVEIVTDFFGEEAVNNDQINIQIMNEVHFKSGDSKTVSLLVSRGNSENTLSGASVMVKILGSNFRPLIYHTKTDSNGVAIVHLQIPQFSRGRAAVLFKALNNGDESEIRRVIQPI